MYLVTRLISDSLTGSSDVNLFVGFMYHLLYFWIGLDGDLGGDFWGGWEFLGCLVGSFGRVRDPWILVILYL